MSYCYQIRNERLLQLNIADCPEIQSNLVLPHAAVDDAALGQNDRIHMVTSHGPALTTRTRELHRFDSGHSASRKGYYVSRLFARLRIQSLHKDAIARQV